MRSKLLRGSGGSWNLLLLLETASLFLVGLPISAGAAPLRYRAAAGEEWPYRLEIVVEGPSVTLSWEGVLLYKIEEVGQQKLRLVCQGELARTLTRQSVGAAPAVTIPVPPVPVIPPPPWAGRAREAATVIINHRGELVEGQELRPLPYLLGYRELLVFEPLPQEETGQWTVENQVEVVVTEEWGPALGGGWLGRLQREATRLPAAEVARYHLAGANEGEVVIEKNYHLRTRQEVNSLPRFEMSGTGRLVFDSQAGRLRELNCQYHLTENKELQSTRYRIRLVGKLLSPEERAAEDQKREKARAEARARLQELEKPTALAPGERERLLEELASGDLFRRIKALQRLARCPREEPAEPICQAILPLLEENNPMVRMTAARALEVWATSSAVEPLLKLAKDPNPGLAGPALLALARFPSSEVIAATVARLDWVPQAAEALKRIGPPAEEAVLQGLSASQPALRARYVEVLGAIGGEKSLAVLEALLDQSPKDESLRAAVRAIRERQSGATEPAPSGAPSSAEEASLHP
jgi:hypothetical protein